MRTFLALALAGLTTGALGTSLLGAGAQQAQPPSPVTVAPTAEECQEAQATGEQLEGCEDEQGSDPTTGAQGQPDPQADETSKTSTTTQEQASPSTENGEPATEPDGAPAAPAAPVPADGGPADPAAQPAPTQPPPPSPAADFAPPVESPGDPVADEPTATREEKQQAHPRPQVEREGRSGGSRRRSAERRDEPVRKPLRNDEGVPTVDNPTTSIAVPGAAPIGVPNFIIDKFRIPPFLLPIYQAAGTQYGIRWQILAAINEIETDYGRNLNVSSAGALGWMQFMPATWKAYGVDANRDGKKDPYNPVDAIFAAARYLKAAGGEGELRRAIFAYNHADWYVDSVLMRARVIGGMPEDLVGSLTGLTQGHFPVHGRARYADDLSEREATRRVARGRNAALPIESSDARRGIDIYAKAGSPVIAVQDGTIVRVGRTKRLGRFVRLRDVYGNTYTYAHLKKVATHVPVPKQRTQSRASIAKELDLPAGRGSDARPAKVSSLLAPRLVTAKGEVPIGAPTEPSEKERLFAHPARHRVLARGGSEQILESEVEIPGYASFDSYFTEVYGLDREDVVLKRMVPGRKVIAGTILGRIGRTSATDAPHVLFEIRPAGRGAPRIDPKPILDGWKLLESTAIYRAQGKNALLGRHAKSATIGQILLMSKEALQQRVVNNPRIDVYSCGERDIRAGIIDRRVLATLEFLAAGGLRPTVTSLRCGHGYYTASGNVSHHSSGNAVDIAMINGVPMLGHQGKGSITDIAVRRLLTLQGTMKPAQIITLMTYKGTDNTFAMGDHHDHIHVGFRPRFDATTREGKELQAVLKPSQWIKLVDRIGEIDNPAVRTKPSKYSIDVPAPRRASRVHDGE